MRKGIIVLLLVLALLVLVSPGVIGHLAQRSINENLGWAANEQGEVIVTGTAYEGGWFWSSGQHRIELQRGELYDNILATIDTADASSLPALLVDTRLDHGLIPASSMQREEGSLSPALGNAISTFSLQLSDGTVVPLPGTLISKLGLTGAVESHFMLESEGADTERGRIDWGGADFVIITDPAASKFAMSGALSSIAVESELETVIVGKVSIDVDLADSGFGFMVGPAQIALDSVAVIGAETTMAAGPFFVDSNSSIAAGRLAADMTFRLENTPMPTGGSGGLEFVARLENVDAAAFAQISHSLDAMRTAPSDPVAMSALEEDVMRLLARGMKVHFDQLDIASPFGQIS